MPRRRHIDGAQVRRDDVVVTHAVHRDAEIAEVADGLPVESRVDLQSELRVGDDLFGRKIEPPGVE